jgi:hypothetical protein
MNAANQNIESRLHMSLKDHIGVTYDLLRLHN